MKTSRLWPLALLSAAALCACDNRTATAPVDATPIPEPIAKTKTLETRQLGTTIDTYEQAPNAEHAAAVNKALAELDGEIAELETRVARTKSGDRDEAEAKRKNLVEYRDTQAARFKLLQAKSAVLPARETSPDSRSAAQKAEDKAKDIGDRVEDGAKRTGEALEKAGRNAKEAIKDLGR